MPESITKASLAEKYGLTPRTLAKLLNVRYYDQLTPLGYERESIILPPRVVEKFVELWGTAEIEGI